MSAILPGYSLRLERSPITRAMAIGGAFAAGVAVALTTSHWTPATEPTIGPAPHESAQSSTPETDREGAEIRIVGGSRIAPPPYTAGVAARSENTGNAEVAHDETASDPPASPPKPPQRLNEYERDALARAAADKANAEQAGETAPPPALRPVEKAEQPRVKEARPKKQAKKTRAAKRRDARRYLRSSDRGYAQAEPWPERGSYSFGWGWGGGYGW